MSMLFIGISGVPLISSYIKIKGVNINIIASRKIAGFNCLVLFCNQHRKLRMTVAIMYLISKSLTENKAKSPIKFEKRELQQNEETSKKE